MILSPKTRIETFPSDMQGHTVSTIPKNSKKLLLLYIFLFLGWFEYGAIDDSIIEKLRDEEDVRVRLAGADELNRAVKSMKDLTPLLPQMRLFLTFLDSVMEGENNFKMVLLVLETYGILVDRMRHKVKPHLR